MADALAISRMARALKDKSAAIGNQTGDVYFEGLAEAALVEAARTVTMVSGEIPAASWVVFAKPDRTDVVRILGRVDTQATAVAKATDLLLREGSGVLYIAQVVRVLMVT